MDWFDIIRKDEFSIQDGKFPGTASEAIAEELSTDNIEIKFHSDTSAFSLTVSYPNIGEVYTVYGDGHRIIHNHLLHEYVEQAKLFIGLVDRLLEIKGTHIHTNLHNTLSISIPHRSGHVLRMNLSSDGGDSDIVFGVSNETVHYIKPNTPINIAWKEIWNNIKSWVEA